MTKTKKMGRKPIRFTRLLLQIHEENEGTMRQGNKQKASHSQIGKREMFILLK